MNDYGHIDGATPSLAISIIKDYRHRGIGSALLHAILKTLKSKGYRQVSLAVQKANYALNMYKKAGFFPVKETEEEYIMLLSLDF